MTRLHTRIAAWLIVLAANVLLLEGVAGLYYLYDVGAVIWLKRSPPSPMATANPGVIGQHGLVLNPYFGYVNRAPAEGTQPPPKAVTGIGSTVEAAPEHDCRSAPDYAACRQFLDAHAITWSPNLQPGWRINNHGFQSPYDYPVAVGQEHFVIGIFGGSVAFHYAFWASDRRSAVLKNLERVIGRPVVILNFALGGGKQPQQAIEHLYFAGLGQRFDLVLNIDGFNEAYIGWQNVARDRVHGSMPTARMLRSIENALTDKLENQGSDQVTAATSRRDRARRWKQTTRLAIVYYAGAVVETHYANALSELEARLSRESANRQALMPLLGAGKPFQESVEELAEVWFRNSQAMAAIARQHGSRYLHVLQPNQYFSARRFTKNEIGKANVLGEGDAPLREVVPTMYRAYLKRAPLFPRAGVDFVSAVHIFDRVEADIYFDWCCHFNERGNRLLDLLIQRAALGVLDRVKYAEEISRIEKRLTAEARMPLSELLSPKAPDLQDAERYDAQRLATARRLIDGAAASLRDRDLAAAQNAYDSALAIVGSLYGRNPRDRDILHAHVEAYRGRAEISNRRNDRDRELAELRSAVAALAQIRSLGNADNSVPEEILSMSNRIKALELGPAASTRTP